MMVGNGRSEDRGCPAVGGVNSACPVCGRQGGPPSLALRLSLRVNGADRHLFQTCLCFRAYTTGKPSRRDMSMVVSAIGGKSWGSRAFTVVKEGFVNGVKGLGGEGRRKSIGGWGCAEWKRKVQVFHGFRRPVGQAGRLRR